ncbi:MAG: CTP synthase [Alphaproteobacteria bacterium]
MQQKLNPADQTGAKLIFMTGGVVSSLGKGLAGSAIGALLQARGYRVRLRKLDPYLNLDPGTMNPYQHGECFVTDDGAETDLDLGHYERFTARPARKNDNITTGQIYSRVLARERRGDYLGGTVQVIPHVTDEIKDFIMQHHDDADFVIAEIGGTVGDMESLPFLEAIRQLAQDIGRRRCAFIHLTLLPYIASSGELKTKPTQHSVKELLNVGIQADFLLCRSERDVAIEQIKKIALFCNLPVQRVFPALDVDTIYDLPIRFYRNKLDEEILNYFDLAPEKINVKPSAKINVKSNAKPNKHQNEKFPTVSDWQDVVDNIRNPEDTVHIAIVGKYIILPDAYKSLIEALTHGGIGNRVKVVINWVDAESVTTDNIGEKLGGSHGVIVPGGFGLRGVGGKMIAIQYARLQKIPFMGICFGMQLAVLEALQNIAGDKNATSSEFGKTENPAVGLLTEWQRDKTAITQNHENLGGTMRLGAYDAILEKTSHIANIYGKTHISERHRHRYEVNKNYQPQMADAGIIISGWSQNGLLPETIERQDHPWFIAVQFHPELKSLPFSPHPLFLSFIAAAIEQERLV